ncbi:hypothetical protein GH714_040844 [Hevea brasiliensis]|uniref:Protein kinase domain-containing protein n=1 Tax=Hevea brasiliensis TaxID=3981 RepID=A0A6A6MVR2_HEVBR|nr:hypothetical protein GH714_040844 [Hevea brasiliensis]
MTRPATELREQQPQENGELSCCGSELGESGRASSNGDSLSFRLRNLPKYIEGEQVAAGWPAWLSAVAGEAIRGWVPLKVDAYEKLEKKVRFDNFEPESVRFMAREILILRRLNHPNVMKLDGLITSRLSCSIYLVFEYMEHDITGLLSCPDVRFSESQIKCYMKQLLSGLEHCHSMGVMHRDIKGSNLLVNNEGLLKVGDFGLANFCNSGHRQPLTSRVVTLWYRPPELLLGSTDYGASVDLWSVGCVFAELLLGKPVLQGRTEYFTAKPYACDPSSLPKYPPSKEIDAKNREEARRKISGKIRGAETRKPTRKPGGIGKLHQQRMQQLECNVLKKTGNNMHIPKGGDGNSGGEARKPSFDKMEEIFHVKNAPKETFPFLAHYRFLVQVALHGKKAEGRWFSRSGDKVDFSGPLLTQSHRVDELLERHERHIRQAVRKSWFQRVFDCCFSTDVLEEDEYKVYLGGIVAQLQDHFPDASFMVFNFREGERRSQISDILSQYDMTVMDYPRQYEGCPMLPLEMIHHFLRSSESWLSLEGQQNVLLMHCERGGWPVLAFMLADLLLYRKQYNGEQKTLEMIYKQAPKELLHLLSLLNPQPSQLRYLQYISRRNFGADWPPSDTPLVLDCLMLRALPLFEGGKGCRPVVRVYGQDHSKPANRNSKLLFSTSKTKNMFDTTYR